MVTDNERREVALRIREKGSISYYSDVFKLVMGHEPPFGTSAREDDESLAERLSDLIEPEPERTCRVKPVGNSYMCLACRAVTNKKAVSGMSSSFCVNYCPNCGAKIVGVKLV